MTGAGEWLRTAREERWGILTDLAFAIIWVTIVETINALLGPPTMVYYMLMLAGIVAYFGFVWNFEIASKRQNQ